jgi:DNA end-binding protein Ku
MYERSYFLEPDSKSPKAYKLLRQTLEDTDRIAIVQYALRQKTRLGALRVRGDVLLLQALLWGDEVREAKFPSLETDIKISDKELEMSSALVESMAHDFDPDEYTDDYQVQLRTLIEAKLEKGEALDTEATFGATEGEAEGGDVIDLMEALKRSLDKKRGKEKASDDEAAASKTSKSTTTASKPKARAKKKA